jgi:hypothetical protein
MMSLTPLQLAAALAEQVYNRSPNHDPIALGLGSKISANPEASRVQVLIPKFVCIDIGTTLA